MDNKKFQFSQSFKSTQSDLMEHNGKSFQVIRKKDGSEFDIEEVGNMYIIRLETGEEIEAFEDEITDVLQPEEESLVKNIKVTKDNIEELVEQWHNSESVLTIYEYLGMTKEEYFKWVETDELTYREPVTLATHNGKFHADDVFAAAVLSFVFPGSELIRSRNPEDLAQADIVFDVGGGVYDHHSIDKEYRLKEDGQPGIPYASFGLIWRDFGHRFLERFGIAAEHHAELVARLDKEFVEGIDAFDNGVEMNTSDPVSIRTASMLISDFNVHAVNKDSEKNAFEMASKMAEIVLINIVTGYEKSISEKDIIVDAFHNRKQKELLILPVGCNWKRALVELDTQNEVQFVVYPDEQEGYRIQVVTVSPDSFQARKDLPEAWAGKRDKELDAVVGIEDAVFCHPGRFLAGAQSKESIMKMAEQALNA